MPALFQAQGIPDGQRGRGRVARRAFASASKSPTAKTAPFTISAATFDRIKNPAKGRDGGGSGVKGVARLGSGKALPDKGIHVIPTGDSLVVELPGGGGFGDPRLRAKSLLEADMKAGLVSPELARKDYYLGT